MTPNFEHNEPFENECSSIRKETVISSLSSVPKLETRCHLSAEVGIFGLDFRGPSDILDLSRARLLDEQLNHIFDVRCQRSPRLRRLLTRKLPFASYRNIESPATPRGRFGGSSHGTLNPTESKSKIWTHLSPFPLHFKLAPLENLYSLNVTEWVRKRVVFVTLFTLFITITLWPLGVYSFKQTDLWNRDVWVYRLFHWFMGITSLVLCAPMVAKFGILRRLTQHICYFTFATVVCIWGLWQILAAFHTCQGESQHLPLEEAILVLALVHGILPLIVLDVLLPSRTLFTLPIHVAHVILYAVAAVATGWTNPKRMPWTWVTARIIGYSCVPAMLYFGSFNFELQVRCSFYNWIADWTTITKLKSNIDALNTPGKLSTPAERVLQTLLQATGLTRQLLSAAPIGNDAVAAVTSCDAAICDSYNFRELHPSHKTVETSADGYGSQNDLEIEVGDDAIRLQLRDLNDKLMQCIDQITHFADLHTVAIDQQDGNVKSVLDAYMGSGSLFAVTGSAGAPSSAAFTSVCLANEKSTDTANRGSLSSLIPQSVPDNNVKLNPRELETNWNFSVLKLHSVCSEPLIAIGDALLADYCNVYKVPRASLLKMLKVISNMYNPKVPYHNALHGAMVAQKMACLSKLVGIKERMTCLEHATMIIASLGHDVGHPARTNAFFVATQHPLAQLFNDRSVLENYHACCTLNVLRLPECNVFKGVDPVDFVQVRRDIVSLILATDTYDHFEAVSKFALRCNANDFSLDNPDTLRFVKRMLIKAADVAAGTMDWETSVAWTQRLMLEFYSQGREEKLFNLPISSLCDASKHAEVPIAQATFLRVMVLPLYNVCCNFCPNATCLWQVQSNIESWEKFAATGQVLDLPDLPVESACNINIKWALPLGF